MQKREGKPRERYSKRAIEVRSKTILGSRLRSTGSSNSTAISEAKFVRESTRPLGDFLGKTAGLGRAYFCFICPEVFFHLRVIGAYPVTTDSVSAMNLVSEKHQHLNMMVVVCVNTGMVE